jgi:hypothetical protein
MILHCLDHVGNVERAFGYKRKLNIYAKNGLIWRVTILEVLELRDVSLVLKKMPKKYNKKRAIILDLWNSGWVCYSFLLLI